MDEDLKSLAGGSERPEGAATASTTQFEGSRSGTVVDGQVFLKLRSCIACGRKNCDPNEITSGPLSNNRFTVWHRGSSEDPQSKQDRICQLTYQHGAFGDESLEEFVNQRMRKDPQLQGEFMAAREAMLEILNDGRARFKGKAANAAKQRLDIVRKKTVEEFKTASTEIVTPYTAIDRAVFEKENPGVIEKKGLKVAKKMIEGKKREVVLIRKNREGVWDLNVAEKSGVRQLEEVDNSDMQLHESQHALKFASSKKRLHEGVAEKANDSSVLAADSLEDQGHEQTLPRLPDSSDEDDDGLRVRSSLLDDDESPPRKSQRPAPSNNSSVASAPKSKVKAASPPAVSKALPAGSKALPAGSKTSSVAGSVRQAAVPEQEKSGGGEGGRVGRPNKFKNHSPVEVLEANGLPEVKACRLAAPLGSKGWRL